MKLKNKTNILWLLFLISCLPRLCLLGLVEWKAPDRTAGLLWDDSSRYYFSARLLEKRFFYYLLSPTLDYRQMSEDFSEISVFSKAFSDIGFLQSQKILRRFWAAHSRKGDIPNSIKIDPDKILSDEELKEEIGENGWYDLPLYIFSLAGIFRLFGPAVYFASAFNIFLFGFSTVLIFLIGERLLNRRSGIMAAVIHAFYPMTFFTNISIFPESLCEFFLLASIYFMVLYRQDNGSAKLIFSGIFMGLAMLTKESMLFLPAWLALGFLLFGHKKDFSAMTIYLLIALAIFCIWPIRNALILGKAEVSLKLDREVTVIRDNIQSLNAIPMREHIRNYASSHKPFYFGTSTIGLMRILGYDHPEWRNFTGGSKRFIQIIRETGGGRWVIWQYGAWAYRGAVYLLALFSFGALLIKRRFESVIFICGILMYFIILCTRTGPTRYFFLVVPFLALLAAGWLTDKRQKLKTNSNG